MKRVISLFVICVLLCGMIPAAAASDEALKAANALHQLGLFNGVGNNADGTPNYDLDRAPTRNEAVTMLVRLLGKENEAKTGQWSIPFTDVADWAKPYVGYAYANQLTNGTSATTFSGNDLITASQYITFVLRALGYSSSSDFQWNKAWELSDRLGFTNGQYQSQATFLRGDVAIISNNALNVAIKGNNTTLKETLTGSGSVKPAENNDLNSILVNTIWHGQTVEGEVREKELFLTGDGKTYQVVEVTTDVERYLVVEVGSYQIKNNTITLKFDEQYVIYDDLISGWIVQWTPYEYPITILSADSIQINRTKMEKRRSSEWFPSVIEQVNAYRETLYALDGRTKEVPLSKVAAEEAVGWYTWEHYVINKANDLVQKEGYSAAIEFMEKEGIDYSDAINDEYDSEIYQHYRQLLQDWQKAIKCPVAIVGHSVSYNSIGTPEVNVRFRNLTSKTITRLDLTWTCLDAYGKPTADYSGYNGKYNGYTNPGETIDPGETTWFTWTLYSNEQTSSISNCYMVGVAFSDGTSWHK